MTITKGERMVPSYALTRSRNWDRWREQWEDSIGAQTRICTQTLCDQVFCGEAVAKATPKTGSLELQRHQHRHQI